MLTGACILQNSLCYNHPSVTTNPGLPYIVNKDIFVWRPHSKTMKEMETLNLLTGPDAYAQ